MLIRINPKQLEHSHGLLYPLSMDPSAQWLNLSLFYFPGMERTGNVTPLFCHLDRFRTLSDTPYTVC